MKQDTVEMKQDTVEMKQDTVEMKQDTVEMKQDTVEMKQDTVEMKQDTVEMKQDTVEMKQDTGKFRKNIKDQYFTKSSIASKCINKIFEYLPDKESFQWIEPSAGNGVFIKLLPIYFDIIAIDIDPKSDNIQKEDFLNWNPSSLDKKMIFFGNPPFGRQSSLAKSFIKHSSKYGDFIAFILPRSFVKPSMSRVFPLNFHCIFNEELEKNAFEVNNKYYNVPCVFQIWEKKNVNRIIPTPIKENGFEYVKYGKIFDIAFKRVGGLAGKCYPYTITASDDYNSQFHYFLKLNDVYIPHIKKIIYKINLHKFPSNTVGPRSISKSEANEIINQILIESLSSC